MYPTEMVLARTAYRHCWLMGHMDGHIICNEPKSPVPLAKHRQVVERTVFHINSVFVNVGVSFIAEETRYSMTVGLIQLAHDFHLARYSPSEFVFPPLGPRVCFLFDYHLLTQSLVYSNCLASADLYLCQLAVIVSHLPETCHAITSLT